MLVTLSKQKSLVDGLAELNEPLHTNQPVASLVILIGHEVREDGRCLVVLPGLDMTRKLIHLLNSVWFQKILIVQVIKEDVQPFLSVGNMLLVGGWNLCLHTLQIGIEDLVDGPRCVGDVGSITGRMLSGNWCCTLRLTGARSRCWPWWTALWRSTLWRSGSWWTLRGPPRWRRRGCRCLTWGRVIVSCGWSRCELSRRWCNIAWWWHTARLWGWLASWSWGVSIRWRRGCCRWLVRRCSSLDWWLLRWCEARGLLWSIIVDRWRWSIWTRCTCLGWPGHGRCSARWPLWWTLGWRRRSRSSSWRERSLRGPWNGRLLIREG